MKHTAILLILVLAGCFCQAQTFEEWFRQKETRKKYLIQQIAAFQVYLGYVQKGYSITQRGLATISNIKNGDFNLHRDFFGALRKVNPKISRYAKVADIIALQMVVLQIYKDTYRQVRESRFFNEGEKAYVLRVYKSLLKDCHAIIDVLTDLITDGRLEMNDDERVRRINGLYSAMQEACVFAQGIASETKLLAVQRMKEENNVQTSRALNGIKIE